MSTESFQNLVEIVFFFFFMDTVTLPTQKKNGNLDKCSNNARKFRSSGCH